MSDTHAVLQEVLKDVLERFAFMFVEADSLESAPTGADEGLKTTIRFEGKQCGTLTLIAPKEFCQGMAANVLGMDPGQIVESNGEDALKELANVVCGTLTWTLFGDREVFHLSIPSVVTLKMSEAAALLADKNGVALMVEGQPFLAGMAIEKPVE
ncbi:MAG TPA: chemotaxis protein CheX [Verrucomicrobiae bacterium]|nr:chemotaxis protein CheX [Verrucomicrobiae bacterium]